MTGAFYELWSRYLIDMIRYEYELHTIGFRNRPYNNKHYDVQT